MNKHIDDLLYHSGLTAQGCWDELGTYEQEAIEKFAELLVTKCAVIATRCESNGTKNIGAEILEHFGVEDE
jgi:hypothetical protein